MMIDFLKDPVYRRRFLGKSDLLYKALGRPKAGVQVWDLTGGLLVDTVFMLQRGLSVKTFENHIGVLKQIELALERFKKAAGPNDPLNRLDLHSVDSYEFLKSVSDRQGPEIIYMDPMFEDESRESSALPKKGTQWLRANVPFIKEKDLLLAQEAFRVTSRRLVIKRPLHGEELLPKPSSIVKGRSVRFDIYFK